MAVYLNRAHVEEAIAALAERHRCSVANVVRALNACNGDICTACEVLASWGAYSRFVDRAAARQRSKAISQSDLPLVCAATNGVVWVSRKVDDFFGSSDAAVANATVHAVAMGVPRGADEEEDKAGKADGSRVGADASCGFTQVRNLSLDHVLDRLKFLSDKAR